jgi:hypothetical protein
MLDGGDWRLKEISMESTVCGTLAALALSAGGASAQISYFDLFYFGYTRQWSDSPPGPADQYYFSSRIFCSGAGDIGAALLHDPATEFPLTMTRASDTIWSFNSIGYPTRQDLFELFPEGEYVFDIAGGTLGDQSAVIDRQGEFFSPEPPAFTDGTFTAFQGLDAAEDFVVRFTPFDMQPGANTALTYITMYTRPEFELVFAGVVPQPATEMVIPAGTITPGADLALYVTNSSRLTTPDAGFGGAWSVIGFDLHTYMEGYSAPGGLPCPADFNQDGGVDGSDVDAFFAAWENGQEEADVNYDGGVDGADVDTFFAAWEAGGCG